MPLGVVEFSNRRGRLTGPATRATTARHLKRTGRVSRPGPSRRLERKARRPIAGRANRSSITKENRARGPRRPLQPTHEENTKGRGGKEEHKRMPKNLDRKRESSPPGPHSNNRCITSYLGKSTYRQNPSSLSLARSPAFSLRLPIGWPECIPLSVRATL